MSIIFGKDVDVVLLLSIGFIEVGVDNFSGGGGEWGIKVLTAHKVC